MVQPTLIDLGRSAQAGLQSGQNFALKRSQEARAQEEAPLRNRLLELEGARRTQQIEMAPAREARAQSQEDRLAAEQAKRAMIELAPALAVEMENLKSIPTVEGRMARAEQVRSQYESTGASTAQFDDPNDFTDESLNANQQQLLSLIQQSGDYETFGTNKKVGINPSSGKREFFITSDRGSVKFTGIEAPAKDSDMTIHEQKRLSAALDQNTEAREVMVATQSLADNIEANPFPGGVFSGSWGTWLKDMTGNQDVVSDLRKRYNGIRASGAIANLPTGAASDADVQLALSPFPTDNAKSESITRFLRGMAKLAALDEKYSRFKADYLSKYETEAGMLAAWDQSEIAEQWRDEYLDLREKQTADQVEAQRPRTSRGRGATDKRGHPQTKYEFGGVSFTVEDDE